MYFLVGLLAFACALVFDFASLRGWWWPKWVAGLATVILFIYAILTVSLQDPKLSFPSWVNIIAWILFGISLFLLVYSLFIEIPFAQAYQRPGTGDKLVTAGTYALCRHPGVLWFSLFVVSLLLVSRSKQWLTAGPIWIAADWAYAWVQDRYIFPLMFSGYSDYQDQTPLFLPTKASIRRCVYTIGGRERAT